MTTLLLRKADWHDYNGTKYLLEHGADPNRISRWNRTALTQAIRRDNGIENIDLLLDHGADSTAANPETGMSGVVLAARRGRGDVLTSMERRGISIELHGVDELIAACARDDGDSIATIASCEPQVVRALLAEEGTLLAEFAGNGNTAGVRRLLDLGVSANALYQEGDGYYEIAKDSTALHVAALRARHDTLRFLLARGAAVNQHDGKGRTPLALAIRACVDSYWKGRRTPESVEALLNAGASLDGIEIPTGYPEADALLFATSRE
jgi:ankyrin repeat protein